MRALTSILEALSTVEVERRAPAFRIEAYDLRSSTNTINDIVSKFVLDPIAGPRDFTDNAVSLNVTEVGGDYATGGIASSVVAYKVDFYQTGLVELFQLGFC